MGLRSADGIPSFSAQFHHGDEAGLTAAAIVKYIRTAERRRLINNGTCLLYLVFMKHLLKVTSSGRASPLRGEAQQERRANTWQIVSWVMNPLCWLQIKWNSTSSSDPGMSLSLSFFHQCTRVCSDALWRKMRQSATCVKSCAGSGFAPGAQTTGH